jgi:adenylate kinase family enzyme
MLEGSCLCGAIGYRANQLDGPIGHCHCDTCRKAHSASFVTTARVLRDHFSWTRGEEMIRSFESSPGKLRHFCVQCGTHLVAEWQDKPNVILRLGSLDTDPGQVPVGHIWVSHDVPWMQAGEDLPRLPKGIGR